MASYRQYSDQERAVAIAYAEAAGWPDKIGALAEAARQTGIKRELISRWLKGESHAPEEKIVRETKLNMQELIDAELASIFASMEEKRDSASYGTLSIAAGILLDKKLALSGISPNVGTLTIAFERTGISSLPEHLRPALPVAAEPIETSYNVNSEEAGSERPSE